jgi:hypothetical protein
VKLILCCTPSWPRRLQFRSQAGNCLYFEAVFSDTSPAIVNGPEVLSFSWRAPFGVCGLLALPNIHQIFGDNSAEFPRLTRDEACVFSSWKLYVAEMLWRQRRAWLAADQLLGNSVGAIESIAHAIAAFGFDRVAIWGASASSCLVQLAPFGELPLSFGSLA